MNPVHESAHAIAIKIVWVGVGFDGVVRNCFDQAIPHRSQRPSNRLHVCFVGNDLDITSWNGAGLLDRPTEIAERIKLTGVRIEKSEQADRDAARAADRIVVATRTLRNIEDRTKSFFRRELTRIRDSTGGV